MTVATKHETRSCLRKVCYNKANARKTAREMRRKFGHKNLRAYRCGYCEWWHIGHVKKRDDDE